MMTRDLIRRAVGLAGWFMLSTQVWAQWTLTTLSADGATGSTLYGGSSGQQAGYIITGAGYSHAGYWTGTSGSFVDLDPAGTYISYALATNGTQQGGYTMTASTSYRARATLWSGTPESAVELHPSGYVRSAVRAVTATMQGGYADVSLGINHAAIWSGTAGSFVDLHPAGYNMSIVNAMAGSQQGGYALVSGGSGRRALLWNGTAEDYVYLHAPGPNLMTESAVFAMTDTQQGGIVTAPSVGYNDRAAMWSGTANSRVELHPAGATTSRVLAMAGNYQAGQVDDQAAVWTGSSASWINLHEIITAQLGNDYHTSTVTGAYLHGGHVHLVGYTYNSATSSTVAVIWSKPLSIVPTIAHHPQSLTVNAGADATFAVSANGTAPLSYQWRRDGAAIAGANAASYTIAGATTIHAGIYDVVVANEGGSVTSETATLIVNKQPQTITFAALPNRVFTVTPLPLTASASSGLPVALSVATGPATIVGHDLTLTGLGIVTVRAAQTGDATYSAAIEVEQSFTVTASYESWKLIKFTAEECNNSSISGPNAVYGQDGLSNLLKYALGFEPKQQITSGLPQLGTQDSDWVYTYTKPETVTDVTYAVELSTELVNWITASGTHELVSVNEGIETRLIRVPLSTGPNVFFRLKVSQP